MRGPASVGLLAAALALPGGALAAEDEVEQAIAEFQKEVAPPAGPDAREKAIQAVAVKHDPRVAAALKPFLQDPDRAVRVQAARVIGEQKDAKIANVLEAMATREIKKKETDSVFLAALVEGVGDADAKGQFEFLVDISKKWLDKDSKIVLAAAEGYAQVGSREAVDELVKLLGVADTILQNMNGTTQKNRDEVRKALVPILRRVTGKEIGESKVWKTWWDDNKKTWKPLAEGATAGGVAADALEYTDDAYGWSVKRPSKAWIFEKPKNDPLKLQASVDGSAVAWVTILSTDLSNYKEKNAEQVAEAIRKILEPDFTQIDAEKTDWNKQGKWKGLQAVTQEVVGRHKTHGVVTLRNVFAMKGSVIYRVESLLKSGSPAYLKEEIDRIFDSFKVAR